MHIHRRNRRGLRAVPAFLAVLALALSLAGCGVKPQDQQLPAFDPEALTEAQTYAEAALRSYDLPEGHEITDAKVMLTDDIAADLSRGVTLAEWDEVLDTRAIVIATATGEYIPAPPEDPEEETALIDEEADTIGLVDEETAGEAEDAQTEGTGPAETAGEASEDPETADESAVVTDGAESVVVTYPLIFLLDENKRVNYTLSGLESAAAADDGEAFTGAVAEEKARELAEAEAVAEQYLADHQVIARQAAQLKEKIDHDADFLWTEEGVSYVKGNSILTNYVVLLRQADVLRWEADALKGASDAEQERAIQAKAESDGAIKTERVRLYDELLDVRAEKDALRAENASQLSHLIQTVDELSAGDPEYYYQDAYLRECVANRACNSYDICLREEIIYHNAIDTADQALATDDPGRRDYLMALDAAKSDLLTDYSDALKAHASSVVGYEAFQAEQADALAAMNESFAAVREEQGEGYETSSDYLKLRVKYKNLLGRQEAYEADIRDTQAKAEEVLAAGEAAIQAIEDAETQRLHDQAVAAERADLDAFLLNEAASPETRSEYDAEPGQWGVLHPDFIAWLNGPESADGEDSGSADAGETDGTEEEPAAETAAPVSGSGKEQTKPAGDKEDKTPAAQSDKPDTSSADKPDTSSADKPDTAVADKPDTAVADKPDTAATDKPDTSSADKPDTAAADKPDTSTADKPDTATANKPDTADSMTGDTSGVPADGAGEAPADSADTGTYGGGGSSGLRDTDGSDHISEYLDSHTAA